MPIERVADPSDRAAVREALARTYEPGGGLETGWEAVQQYERVREHAAEHPDQGSSAVARRLDLPRGRVRGWVDGDGKPDAVRGVSTAAQRGWLDLDWEARRGRAMSVLVVWTVVGGAVDEQGWQPAWVPATGTAGILWRVGEWLGVEWTRRHEADANRATEWLPRRDRSVLGRLLAVLGAPVGDRTKPPLPEWLVDDRAPDPVVTDAARTVVQQRGSALPERPGTPLQLYFKDPTRRQAVRDLLVRAAGSEDVISGSPEAEMFRVDAAAAATLSEPPLADLVVT